MQTVHARISSARRRSAIRSSLARAEKAAEDAVRHAQVSLTETGKASKALLDQGVDVVREGAGKVESAAARHGARASSYVRERPWRSLLIATAAGALLALVASIARRR